MPLRALPSTDLNSNSEEEQNQKEYNRLFRSVLFACQMVPRFDSKELAKGNNKVANK